MPNFVWDRKRNGELVGLGSTYAANKEKEEKEEEEAAAAPVLFHEGKVIF